MSALEAVRRGRRGGELVVLVHGIWMHGVAMRVFAGMLEEHGFRTHRVSYDFLRSAPAENAETLAAEIRALGEAPVHLVGHSLGGIVVLHLLHTHPEIEIGRAVLLGSPVRGSDVARRLHANALLRPLLGRSVERGLLGGAPGHDGRVPIGIITGSGRFGLTALLYPIEETSDGVVAESETLLENVVERISLPRSHSALIFSRRSAEHVARFLREGTFGGQGRTASMPNRSAVSPEAGSSGGSDP